MRLIKNFLNHAYQAYHFYRACFFRILPPKAFLPILLFFIVFFASVNSVNAESWLSFESAEVCGDPDKHCWGKELNLTLPDGSKVSCALGYFDAAEEKITLYAAQGGVATLEGRLPTGEEYKIEADRYTLTRRKREIIVLAEGPIVFHGGPWGEAKCDRKMETCFSSEGKLQTILLEGITILSSNYGGKKCCRIPGKLLLDFDAGTIIGKSSEEQVYFEGDVGGLFANSFKIYYDKKTKKPLKYLLEGDVRIKNIFALQESLAGKLDQHALADRMEYDVTEGKAVLNALGGHRVLFLDQAHKMQLSAGELHIFYDKDSKTPIVKGIGDVHLSFGDKELEKIEKMKQDFSNLNQLPWKL